MKIKFSKGFAVSLLITILLLGGGLALLVYSINQGDSKVGIFFIIPFAQTSGIAGLLAVLLIASGFISLMITISLARFSFGRGPLNKILGDEYEIERIQINPGRKKGKKSSSFGGVIFLGPIPIVFGSNTKVTRKMMYAALIITVILITLTILWAFIGYNLS